MNYSKFNDADNYRRITKELIDIKMPCNAIFAAKPNEHIVHTKAAYCSTSVEELEETLSEEDIAIVENIGVSKYLNSLQVYEFLTLRGFDITREKLRRKILNLIRYRVIQENEIIIDGALHGIKYYELDYYGYIFARQNGVIFHMGNRYMSYSKREERNITPDTPIDVKRILAGNQIVIGLLKNNIRMTRFGIMETIRSCNIENVKCMLRTAAIVRIDEESVLAYEVVRDTSTAYDKLRDKIERYYKLLDTKDYIASNFHNDKVYPQLIICGESLSHNVKIMRFLKDRNLWSDENPILFTEDLLNMKNSRISIYRLKDDCSQEWYALPYASCDIDHDKNNYCSSNVFVCMCS
jgi:hypothetical protein